MNPTRYLHTVSVQRAADVISGDGELTSTESTVVASLRCMVEPLSAKQVQLLVGRVANPRFRLTWTPPLSGDGPGEGDRITLLSGPGIQAGLQCTLAEVVQDTMRVGSPGYRTGVLEGIQVAG